MNRKRILYLILLILIIAAGLLLRRLNASHPSFITEYLPDALWSTMVFFMFAFIFKNSTPVKLAVLTLVFSYFIELTQLYDAIWINSIRNTKPFGLILGYGFLWSDLLCYTAGTAFAYLLDKSINKI